MLFDDISKEAQVEGDSESRVLVLVGLSKDPGFCSSRSSLHSRHSNQSVDHYSLACAARA